MTGQKLKQAGMQQVLFHAESWTEAALEKLRAFCKVRKEMGEPTFAIEEFKQVMASAGWQEPHHANCYGNTTRTPDKWNA